jgi:DNA-binding response OmpR family regulator
MPRPRSILWVDDEVDSLTAHVMFLEDQGFTVDTSAHGDDAIVMLQRQAYGVVLLDEHMPGRRGSSCSGPSAPWTAACLW